MWEPQSSQVNIALLKAAASTFKSGGHWNGDRRKTCSQEFLVDLVGFEPTTSSMPWKRAPNCATGPRYARKDRVEQERNLLILPQLLAIVKPFADSALRNSAKVGILTKTRPVQK
jgi:hypothetical protein